METQIWELKKELVEWRAHRTTAELKSLTVRCTLHDLTVYRVTIDKLILNIPKPGLATNSLPISKDTLPPLDPKDYPKVQFWTAKAFKTHCNNISGETDGLATQEKRHGRCQKGEDNEDWYPYLETADGSLVPQEVIITTGHKARRVWHSLRNIGQAPPSWGRASESAFTFFNNEILNVPELEFFRYCESN